ncbi:MAG: SusC/RagA family TonB-linked outer membrane protein [Pseudobacter sp.]|uniref:SusC/RagA family TonB-linked outer membrane protein n=1 Tax=Pseudobacter sp. TaxID=2045420 RepID=UPI003F80EF50
MRLTVLLLTVALLNVQASGLSQTVTLSAKDISLRKVFSIVKEQTGYVVFGNSGLFNNTKPVSVNVEKMPLTAFLNLVFTNQPLSYSIDGKTIFIAAQQVAAEKKEAEKISFDLYPEQGREIWGLLRNLNSEPLGGASITNKRTKKGTTTNGSGYFRLKDVETGDTLIASFIGYKTEQVRVGETAEVMILLQLAENQLDQVIIQAYGTTTRRTGTGAITRVSGDEIAKANVQNPLLALVGRVPGLVVTPLDGHVSGKIKMEIRGRKTMNPSFVSEPLIVIDGVPQTILDINGGNYESGSSGVVQSLGMSPTGGQSPLFGISPADIESVEVLRDADATAIYGSRGANGVLLITTRKGSSRGAIFRFDVNQGVNMVTNKWDLMNTQQYLKVRREAFANDGLTPTPANAPDLMTWDTTRNTDWQKELWGNWGKTTNINASLSGGNEFTTYRLSGGFDRTTDILTKSGSNDRISFGVNIGHTSLSRKFKLNFSALFGRTDVDLISTPAPVLLSPNSPPIYAPDGTLNYKEYNDAGLYTEFPFGELENSYVSGTSQLNAALDLSYDILKELKALVKIGYGSSNNSGLSKIPISGQNPLFSPMGSAIQGGTNNSNWIVEPQLAYKTTLGGGRFDAIVGATYQSTTTKSWSNYGIGFTNDAFLESISMASVLSITSNNKGQYKYAGLFGRLSYNYEDKYIINIGGRRDGSSRFGKKNQFGNFGSVGLAWIVSEEKWMKKILPEEISMVKLKASYGMTGGDGVGDYRYMTRWGAARNVNETPYHPYDGTNPLVSWQHVNGDYHWQTTKKLDLTLSMGFLNDRIVMDVTRYIEKVDDQLTDYPTPIMTGFPSVTANWAARLKNTGTEVAISARVIEKKDLRLSLNFNIYKNANLLDEYPDFEHSPYVTQYRVGSSLNAVYLLHYLGVDPQTGKYSFEDHDKDGVAQINSALPVATGYDDRYVVLDLAPKYTGGAGANISYKRWDLGMQFSFSRKYMINPVFMQEGIGGRFNMPAAVIGNYWEKPGDVKRFAAPSSRYSAAMNFFKQSDGAYADIKMIRLSNFNLAYSLPDLWMQKARMKSARVFVRAYNLFFISNSEGLDPEATNISSLPMPRVVTGGISISL